MVDSFENKAWRLALKALGGKAMDQGWVDQDY